MILLYITFFLKVQPNSKRRRLNHLGPHYCRWFCQFYQKQCQWSKRV